MEFLSGVFQLLGPIGVLIGGFAAGSLAVSSFLLANWWRDQIALISKRELADKVYHHCATGILLIGLCLLCSILRASMKLFPGYYRCTWGP